MMHFLKYLRGLDEERKRRWLVGLSVCAMAVIIYVWLGYFVTLFPNFSAPAAESAGASSQPVSFADAMKSGAAIIISGVREWVSSALGTIFGPKNYTITP